jgi:hypothetical protein
MCVSCVYGMEIRERKIFMHFSSWHIKILVIFIERQIN